MGKFMSSETAGKLTSSETAGGLGALTASGFSFFNDFFYLIDVFHFNLGKSGGIFLIFVINY